MFLQLYLYLLDQKLLNHSHDRVESEAGTSFLDKMIALVEGAERNKTPNEIALFTLLTTLTIIFLVVIETLYPIASYLHLILPIA
ncbi:hypothetical protein B8A13_15000, partial [Staphylococcus aureus]